MRPKKPIAVILLRHRLASSSFTFTTKDTKDTMTTLPVQIDIVSILSVVVT
jgi:hypothetical protein